MFLAHILIIKIKRKSGFQEKIRISLWDNSGLIQPLTLFPGPNLISDLIHLMKINSIYHGFLILSKISNRQQKISTFCVLIVEIYVGWMHTTENTPKWILYIEAVYYT